MQFIYDFFIHFNNMYNLITILINFEIHYFYKLHMLLVLRGHQHFNETVECFETI